MIPNDSHETTRPPKMSDSEATREEGMTSEQRVKAVDPDAYAGTDGSAWAIWADPTDKSPTRLSGEHPTQKEAWDDAALRIEHRPVREDCGFTPAVRAALSPVQGELPKRPTKENVKQFATMLTGISYVQWAEFVRYADSLESLLRASNAEVARLTKCGMIEIMMENPNADSFVREKEAEVGRLREELGAAREYQEVYREEFLKTCEEARENTFAAGQQKGREECLESWRAMQDALRTRAIFMTYDSPGDVPEPCGLWCDLCKEHIETDRLTGHKENCLLSEQAIITLPKVGQ